MSPQWRCTEHAYELVNAQGGRVACPSSRNAAPQSVILISSRGSRSAGKVMPCSPRRFARWHLRHDMAAILVTAIITLIAEIIILIIFYPGPGQNSPPAHPYPSSSPIPITPAGPGPSPQQSYIVEIERDRKVLFKGELLIPADQSIKVGQAYTFIVEVSGPAATRPTIPGESNASQVLIVGSVGVSLACFQISCTALSADR